MLGFLQVAFGSVHQAVLFCLEAQYRLLEAAWPREVLKLANCREVRAWHRSRAPFVLQPMRILWH